MSDKITDLPVANSIDAVNDTLPIVNHGTNTTTQISRNTFLNLASQPLGLTDTQSPTNKTFNNTNSMTLKDGSFTLNNTSDTTKVGKFSLAGLTTGNTRTYTLPDYNATLSSLAGTETLTNKTLTSPTINTPTITNATITADTYAGYTVSNTGTVLGMSVTAGVLASAALAGAVNPAALASAAVTASKIGTDSSFAFTSWTPTLTNIVLGNGTMVAAYNQIGKRVLCRLRFTFGSTSSISGIPIFSLPITANSEYGTDIYYLNVCSTLSAGNNYQGIVRLRSTTLVDIVAFNVSATYGTITGPSSTVPNTWTTGDYILASWEYEAA